MILEARRLSKAYGGVQAVRDVGSMLTDPLRILAWS